MWNYDDSHVCEHIFVRYINTQVIFVARHMLLFIKFMDSLVEL